MVVDSHVHTRDFNERHKETIGHALYVAQRAGVSGIFAMPNTRPSLVDKASVQDYLRISDEADTKEVFFGAYLALTADREQVKQAVQVYRDLFPRVVGFKLYAGHSTNNIGVVQESDQQAVFETLAREEYKGVLFVHAEKEWHMNAQLFDRNHPITHATRARPPIAETTSIRDILQFARDAGYKGKLHIAHISTPAGVSEVLRARAQGQDVSCGVTPHHLFFSYDQMRQPDGLLWKMNPPLRAPGVPETMLSLLHGGSIDWVETDHAPHLKHEKLGGECASGENALHAWPLFIRFLQQSGFSETEILRKTHNAIIERFDINIPFRPGTGVYDSQAYDYNPWEPLEKKLASKRELK